MAYNRSRATVFRMERYLQDMLVANRTITWPAQEPEILARRIREAMHAVKFHPQYEKFTGLKLFYKIYTAQNYVEARFQGQATDIAMPEVLAPLSMKLEEVTDLMTMIGACIKYGAKSDEIYFPNAILTKDEMLSLYKWGQTSRWRLIDQQDLGITLTRRKVESFLLWDPSDVKEKE